MKIVGIKFTYPDIRAYNQRIDDRTTVEGRGYGASKEARTTCPVCIQKVKLWADFVRSDPSPEAQNQRNLGGGVTITKEVPLLPVDQIKGIKNETFQREDFWNDEGVGIAEQAKCGCGVQLGKDSPDWCYVSMKPLQYEYGDKTLINVNANIQAAMEQFGIPRPGTEIDYSFIERSTKTKIDKTSLWPS